MKNDGQCYVEHPDQPPALEWTTADGVFVKQLECAKAGMIVPQHAHAYAHTSLIVKGSFAVRTGDEQIEHTYVAPFPLLIPANTKHFFRALEDGSTLYCIHHEDPIVTEENQLVK